MNAPEQKQGEQRGPASDGSAIPPAATPVRTRPSILASLKKQWRLVVVILVTLIGIVASYLYQLRNVPHGIRRQEAFGFCIAICGVVLALLFVWRLSRFLAEDTERVEELEEKESPPTSQTHSAEDSRPDGH
jgi:hypothetical protein